MQSTTNASHSNSAETLQPQNVTDGPSYNPHAASLCNSTCFITSIVALYKCICVWMYEYTYHPKIVTKYKHITCHVKSDERTYHIPCLAEKDAGLPTACQELLPKSFHHTQTGIQKAEHLLNHQMAPSGQKIFTIQFKSSKTIPSSIPISNSPFTLKPKAENCFDYCMFNA